MADEGGSSTRAALAQALSYLAGVRGIGAETVESDAALLAEWLAGQRLGIVPLADTGAGRLSPLTLRAMREGLGLTPARLAKEAGVIERTVLCAERPGSGAYRTSVEKITAALQRLGVKPERDV